MSDLHSTLSEIFQLLETTWSDDFTYDENAYSAEGVVILQWKQTKHPIPLNPKLDNLSLEASTMPRRELMAKIKLHLPATILKDRISEANSLLRQANRRALKVVQKDFQRWRTETVEILEKIFGREIAKTFSAETPLPSSIRAGSIQALHHGVETKVDYLKTL